ncbi:type II toxin-antitoxin system RelE/ParE family toxin [Chryseobacterium wangxinyae]|uniref:type II toxin-antitoxin system RelE/ParE family toxin n=1 Tax=Chryseobacterium sp. CY350 TaxID=2997336 RepID=UPI00226F5D26|nr:type II toxin-antitoxin system RelE/ParE family toxin [Chryseobacterium sp. CY350]MCY0976138.1 type II toxin-antitoxin system RelE/ParE family toxin [Chryseobacterium sp. CY350]WBZ94262.1 type II toxin-antitoxin system RelE/ParE family toxin [Chryseobacterium sp. CY350]
MKSGYEIVWSDQSLKELEETIEYLERNFTNKELRRLSVEIERNLDIISENPLVFSRTEKLDIRKVVTAKFNTLYYKIENEKIEIISFFSNRQNPSNRKI